MSEGKVKFRINVDKYWKGHWCFGIGLYRWEPEIYFYIQIFKIAICIGMIEDDDEYL